MSQFGFFLFFHGCNFWQIMSHTRRDEAVSKTPSNAANESGLYFPDLEAAPDGSFVAQQIPKCIATSHFSPEERTGTAITT